MDVISWLYKGQEKASLPTAECVILEIAGCPEKVDDAHLRAAEIEMRIAHSTGAAEHISDKMNDMEKWCVD